MITEAFISIAIYILGIGASIINALMTAFIDISNIPYSGAVGATYIFGNLGLFNQILPVTELFFFASLALMLKGTVFGFKIFWAASGIAAHIFNRFIRFKI